MNVLERIPVPTGDILIVEGEHGKLECLSIGDYGKAINVKCDAMGLTREPERVRHQAMLPLEEKWVVTISTQYGCSVGCSFCDVPKVGPGRNATFWDLVGQVKAAVALHPEVMHTNRLNLHYARMGEPTFNPNVLLSAVYLKAWFSSWGFHPVVSTMVPNHYRVLDFIGAWMRFKNDVCHGEAGLQLSINSTDEIERQRMFGGVAKSLEEVSQTMGKCNLPLGRKITLNFAVADWTVDAELLASLFSPEYYVCKLTPMHRTSSAEQRGIHTAGDYTTYHPYRDLEESLKAVGYDVLVFIASESEDLGRITCGNAILSGTRPFDTETKTT